MRIHEITDIHALQVVKAFNMLRNSSKYTHLPDEKIQQMAHAVVKKWNTIPTTSEPELISTNFVRKAMTKPRTVKDLTDQYKRDKVHMGDEDFKKYYGFGRHSKGKYIESNQRLNEDYDEDFSSIADSIIRALETDENWDKNGDVDWDFVASDVWIEMPYEDMGYDDDDFNDIYMDAANKVAKRFGTNPPYHGGLTLESFLEDAINEHRMVWKSTKKGPKLAWRCTSGFRANRTVPDAKDCGKPLDIAQRMRMKVTRARTSKAQARKRKRTLRISPTSRLIRKMNKATAPKKKKKKKKR